MSTDFSSLTGGPRVPVNIATPVSNPGNSVSGNGSGNNVVTLRPAVRQEIAVPAAQTESAAKPTAADVAAQQSSASHQEQQNKADADALRAKVEELNQTAQTIRRSLRFNVDDDTGITVITVRDRETDEVIRQIPSEDLLALARYFAEVGDSQGESKGLLLRAEV